MSRNEVFKGKSYKKPSNLESIAFYKNIGMELTGNGVIDGIPVVVDYSGPREHRLFMKEI